MAIFDVAILGVIVSILGWGISRVEGLRSSNNAAQMRISHNEGQIEVLKADFSSKLDILIFRLRVLEERMNDNN
jgi:hypothetical protein